MSKILNMAAAIIMLGLAAVGTAHARGLHGHRTTHHGHAGPIFGYQPQQPIRPQFNDPVPKLWVPQPGNAVEQLSPIMGAGQPDALGIK